MGKNEYENNFIMGIYRKRHKLYEPLVLIPVIAIVFLPIVGIPIFVVLDFHFFLSVLLFMAPIPLVCGILLIIKNIKIKSFIKVKDINGKVDIAELHGGELETLKDETVFIFPYSEYMEKILYNWFKSLSALKDDRLRMYKVFFDNKESANLAIRENDLFISEANRNQYESETWCLIQLKDMDNGKVVNVKLVSRTIQEKEKIDSNQT